jgi:sugar lactone lactonase YvrE
VDVRFVVGCTILVAACSSSSTGTGTSATGDALAVSVSAPAGILGTVTVTGPGGYAKTLTGTDTLRNLSAGAYTVTAAPQTTTDSLVSTRIVGTVSASPVAVSAGHLASVNVYYVVRGGSGALWVGWSAATDLATSMTSPQLARAGTVIPADTIGAGGNNSEITGSAFDLAGNLWVADFYNAQIEEFTPEELASGTSTPAVTLTFPAGPWGLVFDASNNLWVSFYATSSVEEFSVGQVDGFTGTVNSPAPQVTLTPPGAVGLAFDPSGDLWVACYGDSTVREFSPSVLASGGGHASDSVTSTALAAVTGVTFDASGNLWAGTENGLLVTYTAAQLASPTSPTAPSQTIAASSHNYRFDQVAFDNSGNLWASTEWEDVIEYSPAQLAAGGTPVPARTLTINNEGITAATFTVAFDPHATGLPIAGQRHSGSLTPTRGQAMMLVGPNPHSGRPGLR